MKLNKLFLGLLGLTAMVMSSCSESDDYQWATASGEQVYFSNELPATQEISFDASSFTIPVSRVNTNSSITVPVSITSDDDFFSAPSSITFNAGESKANLTISYDPEKLAYDDYKNVTVTIGKEYSTPYGNDTYSFKGGIASPYKSIGKGKMTDNFWFEATASVTIMQNTQNPNEFRIMSPFEGLAKAAETSLDGNQDPYIQLTLLKPGNTFYDVAITQENLVGYTDINTGYFHSSYEADIYMLFPGRLTKYAAEEFFLHNCVVEWQENGLPGRIQLAPYFYMFGVGGWDNTQADNVVVIDFPGYNPKDLSADIEYLGVLTDAEGAANAAVNLAFGADVTDARAIVVSDDVDDEAVADAIAAGEIEAVQVADGGYKFIPIEEGLTGKLKVVLVILDEGKVKNISSVGFEYYGGAANPWEVMATGDYVYTLFFGSDEEPATDPGLELQYNAEEDVYRITHWGYDVDFTFTMDAETKKVHVPAQFTGVTHSTYGEVYVCEADDYKPEWEDGPSFYDPETLTFHFHVTYFVSAGSFGHGDETFTLTPAEARRLGLDKKMPKVNRSLKPVSKKTHARNGAIMSREQVAD